MRDLVLFGIGGGFASGILCRSFFSVSWHSYGMALLLGLIVGTAWWMSRRSVYVALLIGLCSFPFGVLRTDMMPHALPESFGALFGTKIVFEGRIIGEPDVRETSQRVTIEVTNGSDTTRVLAVAPLYPEVFYGDRVSVTGTLVPPEPFDTATGRTFRYDSFLSKDGIFALVSFAKLTVERPREGMIATTFAALLDLKHRFQESLAQALPEPAASLASGLITGGKQGLGKELLNAFIVAGLVHIVVLSGYNVMIIAEAILAALKFLPKHLSLLIAGSTIVLFVFAAGAGSASLRAGLMALLAVCARATGRTYDVLRVLCVVALGMLVWNPLLLPFDPGFQLSFVATLGLILGADVVTAYLGFVRSTFWRELLGATVAAQISVLPLILYQTGMFSIVSLPVNLMVLPVVPLAMALSAVAGILAFVIPSLAPFFGLPAFVLLTYILEIAQISARFPFASFSVPAFPFWIVPLCYVLFAIVIIKTPLSHNAKEVSLE